jgi:hypothetical protein
MSNKDVATDEGQTLQERNRTVEERLQEAKDATLRLWERNRHLQERVSNLERRLRFVTRLTLALFVGGAVLVARLATSDRAQIHNQIAALRETVTSLRARVEGFDRTVRTGEERVKEVVAVTDARLKQVEQDMVESVKKMVPEILVATGQDGVPITPAGRVGGGTATPVAERRVAGNLWDAATGPASKGLRIVVGKTDAQKTPWVQYNTGGIYVDIDTSSAGFSSTPYYFTSLGGHTNNWMAQGVTSIYLPTAKGFRIHINYRDLTVAQATGWGWYINWVAIGN